MTTLATADLHFSANPRDAYRFHFLERELPRLIREHAVARVLVLGDLCESKDGHSAALVNRIIDGFAAITQTTDVIFLKGNHDYLRADVPFWRFLKHMPRVRWINEPTRLKLRGLGDCLFLPHTPDIGEWAGAVRPGFSWYFCHQTFGGANLGHEHKAVGTAAPFTRKAGDRVVSGDVHVPQQLGAVTYVGAPALIDFGDEYEPRVLLLDGDKMRSVPVGGPQKLLITLCGPDPLAELKYGVRRIFPINAGDVIKVKIELPPSSELSRATCRAAAREWAAQAGVELYAVQVVAPEAERSEKAAARPARRSDDDLVRAYVRKMGKGKVTLAAGLKIAGEVA